MSIYFYLLISVFAFSSSVILEKIALREFDANIAVILKGLFYIVFGIVLLGILKIKNMKLTDEKVSSKDFKKGVLYIILAYILIFLIGNLIYYNVLKQTNEITKLSFIIIVVNTINIIVLSHLIRRERINFRALVGIVLALLGVSITLLTK